MNEKESAELRAQVKIHQYVIKRLLADQMSPTGWAEYCQAMEEELTSDDSMKTDEILEREIERFLIDVESLMKARYEKD